MRKMLEALSEIGAASRGVEPLMHFAFATGGIRSNDCESGVEVVIVERSKIGQIERKPLAVIKTQEQLRGGFRA